MKLVRQPLSNGGVLHLGAGVEGPPLLQELPEHEPALLARGPKCVPATPSPCSGCHPGRGRRALPEIGADGWPGGAECQPRGQRPGEAPPRQRSPVTVTVGRAGSAGGRHPEPCQAAGFRGGASC